MRTTWAIAKKELTVYLTTPLAWVAFTAMAFLSSLYFVALLLSFKQVHDTARSVPGGNRALIKLHTRDEASAAVWSRM